MGQSEGSVIAAIPARWGSTRFPGKALALLRGEPMIAHVVRRASSARLVDAVVVATDDQRIADAAVAAGAEAVITGEWKGMAGPFKVLSAGIFVIIVATVVMTYASTIKADEEPATEEEPKDQRTGC